MSEADSEERKYTTGTKTVQQLGQGFSRAAYRIAHGVAEGMRVYQEKAEESADAKQDGAVRDLLVNTAEGFSVAAVEMSKAPLEVAKATDTEAVWDAAQSVNESVEKMFRKDKKDSDEENTKEDGGK